MATREATFAIPTARLGIAVTPWTIRRLALLARTGAAQAMLIGGESIDAARAWQYGLASRLETARRRSPGPGNWPDWLRSAWPTPRRR